MDIHRDKSVDLLLSFVVNLFDYFQVEKAKGQLLYITGEDDLNWPTPGMVEQSVSRLKAHGKTNYQVWSYPKTGHLIEPPYAPVCVKSYHKVWGKFHHKNL